jgi:arylsulfatase A-like enzyme
MNNTTRFALASAGLFLFSCQKKEQNVTVPPNFIILLADDMGYGDLGCYGHPTIKTPSLDRMAEEGIRLTSFCVSSSVCTPSRASLLTGRYPLRVGLPNVLMPGSEHGLPDSELTFGETLKSVGYQTMYIGKWHLGDREKFNPVKHGFDDYIGILYSNDMMPPWVETEIPLSLMHGTRAIEYPVIQQTLTERYTYWSLEFIEKHKKEPFLLVLSYAMPHVPIFASEKFCGTSRAGLYGDVIETIDWSTGQILNKLDELGIDNNTMVIFLSDNGPWQNMPDRMFGNDTIKPWHCGSAGPLRGSKGNTWEGGIRVPAIFRWPGKIPSGQVRADLVTSMDIYPTLLKAAGAKVPDDREIDGIDLMPFLQGKELSIAREYLYYMRWDLEGIRCGSWKFRCATVYPGIKPVDELYDLDSDPGEKFNVAGYFPEKAKELKSRMEELDGKLRAKIPSTGRY